MDIETAQLAYLAFAFTAEAYPPYPHFPAWETLPEHLQAKWLDFVDSLIPMPEPEKKTESKAEEPAASKSKDNG